MTGLEVLCLVADHEPTFTRHAFVLMPGHALTHADLSPVHARLLDRWRIPVLAKPFELDVLLQHVAHAAERLV